MNNIFDGLDRTQVYIYDMIVWDATQEEHDWHLWATVAAAQAAGTLNREKCAFGVEEVEFLGDLISKDCIKPDGKLIKCIASMPLAKSKQSI